MDLKILAAVLQKYVPDVKYINPVTLQIGSKQFYICNGLVVTPKGKFRHQTIRGFFTFMREDNFLNLKDVEIEQICKRIK